MRAFLVAALCLSLWGSAHAQDATGFTSTITATSIVWSKVRFVSSSGPFISAGSGAPSSADPNGSLYLRSDGGADSTLYTRISGVWVAVPTSSGGGGGGTIDPASWDVNWNFHIPGDLVLDNTYSAEIRANTVDGVDTDYVAITGGGSVSSARGGYTVWRGNEEANNPGAVQNYLGNVSNSYFSVVSQNTNVQRAFSVYVDGKIRLNSYGVTQAQSGDKFLCVSDDTSAFVHSTYSTCGSSSERLKHEITPLHQSLDDIMKIQPSFFRWNRDDSPDVGFNADQVAAVNPLLAVYQEDGQVRSVNDRGILSKAVGAIQELQQEIERLRAELGK